MKEEKLTDITTAIIHQMTFLCTDCNITGDIIDNQDLTCSMKSPSYVIYSARIKATFNTDRITLISMIEEWIDSDDMVVTIITTGIVLTINPQCPVIISSHNDEECLSVTMPTSEGSTDNMIPTSTVILMGVMILMILAFIAIILAIIIKHRCDSK